MKEFFDDFVKRADQFKFKKDTPYIILHIDLSVAHNNLELNVSGDILKVVTATDNNSTVDVRINFPAADPIPLMRYRRLYSFFDKLYITNAAQAGKSMDLLIGVKQFFDIDDFFF